MNAVPLDKEHFKTLYEIACATEPYVSRLVFEHYSMTMARREGFTLIHKGEVVGCISFDNFEPEVDIMLHCTVMSKYQGRWCTKTILKTIADYVFGELGLGRVSGYSIVGMTDKAGEFLVRLGFQQEAYLRRAAKFPDGYHDVRRYGMLKEECRWL